jgi:hypothetical protein
MSEPTESELATARDILIGAIAAAGAEAAGTFKWQWKVAMMIPEVAAMMEPTSKMTERALLCMDAQYIAAEYLGSTYEESSTRLIVSLKSDRNEDVETIRTERTDTEAGKAMRAKLDKLAHGTRILVRKVMEPMHNQKGRSVRVMMHFETLPPRKDHKDAEAAPTNPAPHRVADDAPQLDPGEPARAPGSTSHRTAEEVVKEVCDTIVDPAVRLKVKQALLDNGLWPTTDENLDAALVLIQMERTES